MGSGKEINSCTILIPYQAGISATFSEEFKEYHFIF